MKKPRILVVDDDGEIRASLETFFRLMMGLEVRLESNGSDAIRTLDREDFDIIVQDLQMPGIDGFTVLNHAIKRHPQIIRIVLTGLSDPAITKKVEAMGAVYVSKPPELKVLELVISQALQRLKK